MQMSEPVDTPSIVAFVPMRHDSERVPGKNFRDFYGAPLYAHILETLSNVPELAQVVVDTDSEVISEGVRQRFPHVMLLNRPDHLRAGETPMNDVLLHDVQQVEAEFCLQTHSTNPLLRAETIREAIQTFVSGYPNYDSLFGVTRLQTRLWTGEAKPVNHDPAILERTQDLDPIYEENSSLYLFERESFLKSGNRIGKQPLIFEVDSEEALDIDDEIDFAIAEFLLSRRQR
jgi:CMP-N-acetylneuraminic acid synthetase